MAALLMAAGKCSLAHAALRLGASPSAVSFTWAAWRRDWGPAAHPHHSQRGSCRGGGRVPSRPCGPLLPHHWGVAAGPTMLGRCWTAASRTLAGSGAGAMTRLRCGWVRSGAGGARREGVLPLVRAAALRCATAAGEAARAAGRARVSHRAPGGRQGGRRRAPTRPKAPDLDEAAGGKTPGPPTPGSLRLDTPHRRMPWRVGRGHPRREARTRSGLDIGEEAGAVRANFRFMRSGRDSEAHRGASVWSADRPCVPTVPMPCARWPASIMPRAGPDRRGPPRRLGISDARGHRAPDGGHLVGCGADRRPFGARRLPPRPSVRQAASSSSTRRFSTS